jgi:hypothetical protein
VTKARLIKIENRLAKVVGQPGGKTVADAVRSAEARVESLRESNLAVLDVKVADLVRLATGPRREATAEALDDVYDLANQVFGLAATYGLAARAEAAYSLCDLVDGFRGGGAVNWAAIDVHIDGLRLLGGVQAEGAEVILAGLRRVRARLLDPS